MIRGRLTGKVRFRQGWTAVVLQVEYRWTGMAAYSRNVGEHIDWRDADAFDLVDHALSWLVRPDHVLQPPHADHDAAGADFIARRAERFGGAGEAA
jgi:hypothetical protein